MNYFFPSENLMETGASWHPFGVNRAVVCPRCGELWCRLYLAGGEWRGWTWPCRRCAAWPLEESVPGSILSLLAFNGINPLEHLPDAVLKREFEVHLQRYERTEA